MWELERVPNRSFSWAPQLDGTAYVLRFKLGDREPNKAKESTDE